MRIISIVSEIQGKPFWLVIKLYPQNDWHWWLAIGLSFLVQEGVRDSYGVTNISPLGLHQHWWNPKGEMFVTP